MFKYIKAFFKKSNKIKDTGKQVNLFLNNKLISNAKIIYYKNKYRLYKDLRQMIINENQLILCTSNIKGFNTKFTIINFDVVVCNRFGIIIDNFKNLNNDFISDYSNNYWYLFFMPVGFINFWKIKNGDKLKMRKKYK